MPVDLDTVSAQLAAQIAPRFGEIVQKAERRLEALRREVEDMRAARGTMQWEVDGVGTCFLNIYGGQMTVGDVPLEPPFVSVVLSVADWERFAGGAVGVGLLSPSDGRAMGRSRMERVRAITGAVRFVVAGLPDGDWTMTAYFGNAARTAEPQTTITVAAAAMEKLASGELNPQMAFMQGQVRFTGDAALAMQLGMAMVV